MDKMWIRLLVLALIALAIGNTYLSLAPASGLEAEAQAQLNGELYESTGGGRYVCICGGDNCAPCFDISPN